MKVIPQVFIEQIPEDTGNLKSGMFYAANESRFDSSHLSQELTTFATGVSDREKLREMLDLVCPKIVAPRRFEYRTASNTEDFLSEEDDVRAIGAMFKRVESRGGLVSARTQNKGLCIRLDKDGEGGLPGAQERASQRLVRRLYRNDFRRWWNLLVASATLTGKTWNTSVDPDIQVEALVDLSGDARGIDPNMLIYGSGAWSKRIAALSGSDKSGANAKLLWNMEQLADWIGVDQIVKPKVRYQSTQTAKAKVVGSVVIAYYADMDAGLDSPTNMARFVTPTDSGDVRIYVQDFPKFIEVSAEQYSLVAAPSTLGIVGHNIA